ncbi:hypothetical protein H312_00176 [Anncaliia algerae PRA339]|uniref:ISXO2-like transposase domain-containing protein n=1 Tax=Anncaliia algerae PRA339 TaxID=1288291 RepID=A0A059F5G6_9MICR|nr:hypothetical protein H312_00176 [Anncaliia algerae PRA339]
MENNLVEDKCRCITCNYKKMKLKFSSGLYKWKCSKCKGSESVLKRTLFYKSKMKLTAFLDLIYFWSVNLTQTSARNEINTKSKQTTQKWFDKLKGLTYDIMKDLKPQKIGVVGSIVEIDESLFSKRKYNVGRLVRRVWIVGGIDIRTRDTFFVK